VVDSVEVSGTQVNVAPDGSPVFTRDIGHKTSILGISGGPDDDAPPLA
jgi:hypothetical protein